MLDDLVCHLIVAAGAQTCIQVHVHAHVHGDRAESASVKRRVHVPLGKYMVNTALANVDIGLGSSCCDQPCVNNQKHRKQQACNPKGQGGADATLRASTTIPSFCHSII